MPSLALPIVDGHSVSERPVSAADAVDGVAPRGVLMAHSAAGAAAVLGWAGSQRLSVLVRGGGTKLRWGAAPAKLDVVLDMSRMNRVVDHQAGDLTVTVEAGVRLGELNAQLAAAGQWLPLDPPFREQATVGGLLATNDSGPHRHRFGTPRDLVIGIEVATADGRLAKAGGRVVKNVAGYDLSKIVSGSFGAMAVVVGATFKVAPLPQESRTVTVDALDAAGVSPIVEAMSATQLEPVAFELHAAGAPGSPMSFTSLLRFSSFRDAVAAEAANAAGRLAAVHPHVRIIDGEAEGQLWAGAGREASEGAGVILRFAWRPAQAAPVMSLVTSLTEFGAIRFAGRLGVGSGIVRVETTEQQSVVRRLRESSHVGNVVVLQGDPAFKTRDWVWGAGAAANPVWAAIKSELDPAGILGAGRGPV